ncbi:MAG: hypothetical protein JNL70_07785 [Saprospiraceae bacterium]|nr:hypothetical protein [Saprospiraceae bacterium]
MLKKIIPFIVLTLSILHSNAQIVDDNYKQNQPKENSLLSRYGIGNINPQYFASNSGMGGMTAAYRDKFHFNPFNPASLPSLRTTAYEVGLFAKNTNVKNNGNNNSNWSGNLNNLALAFPTYSVINEVLDRKPRVFRWGMGLSLMPYSSVGYNINTITKAQNPNDSSNITNYFVGSGGTYRLMLGNGFSFKGFSFGANIGYVFGKVNTIRQSVLGDKLAIGYANYFDDNFTMNGFSWNAGIQYDITLDPKKNPTDKGDRKHIVIGAYGNPSTTFSTKSSQDYKRVYNFLTDSITSFSDKKGSGVLPTEYTTGIMYENGLLFKGGIEYKISKWSEYKNDAKPETLLDANQLSIGAEFILDKNKLKSEEEKIRWRVGFHTGKDPRSLGGEQVSNTAGSVGMCLPLRVGRGQQISYMNVGLEYGQLKTKIVSEDYFRINLGFTLNDNTWFLKRKFQ